MVDADAGARKIIEEIRFMAVKSVETWLTDFSNDRWLLSAHLLPMVCMAHLVR